MGTILFNGDSFTYGDELDDTMVGSPRMHTYAHKLSNQLQARYVNLAQNGSSNQKIYRTTTDFLQKTDRPISLVVITWTNFGRFELCENFSLEGDQEIDIGRESDMNQIIVSHAMDRFKYSNRDSTADKERQRILKEYCENVWTMQTAVIHQVSYMNNIQFLCDQMGIGVIQSVIHPHVWQNVLHLMKQKGWHQFKANVTTGLKRLRPECKVGLGGDYDTIYTMSDRRGTIKPRGHACEESHSEFAEQLYNIIREHNVSN